MKTLSAISFIVMILFVSCSQSIEPLPDWVKGKISEFQNQPVGNPPQSVWQYQYKNQTVYFIPAQCCDQYSELYNIDGSLICAPDGGITGQGDGKCPDFFTDRKNEILIWKDSRTQ